MAQYTILNQAPGHYHPAIGTGVFLFEPIRTVTEKTELLTRPLQEIKHTLRDIGNSYQLHTT